ncbi:MAG: serine hydrolase [Armatimonadota bacterium]
MNNFGFALSTLFLAICSAQAQSGGLTTSPDPFVANFIRQRGIKGASLTVWNRQGTIIYSKGFGTTGTGPFTPDTVCRVASISKIFTSVGIMQAVKEGKINLDAPINTYLKYPKLGDPRLAKVTTRLMLQHLSGMESKSTPIVSPSQVSDKLPLTPQAITDWAMTKKQLDREPNTAYGYSNTAYTVLGVILEKATGVDYETYVKRLISPMGVSKSRIGNTLKSGTDETTYYDLGNRTNHSSFQFGSSVPSGSMPFPYGGAFVLESMPGGGGWASTSNDLAKLMIGTFGSYRFFDQNLQAQMIARPPAISDSYYTGLGWNRSLAGTFRTGSLECSSACMIWLKNGYGYAYVQNTCTQNDKQEFGAGKFLDDFTVWMGQNTR